MTAQNITTISGTVAVASTSTSKGIEKVMEYAPSDAISLLDSAHQVMTTADIIGACSVIVLTISFIYTIYSNRKKHKDAQEQLKMDEQFYKLRLEELNIEKAKLKEGIK